MQLVICSVLFALPAVLSAELTASLTECMMMLDQLTETCLAAGDEQLSMVTNHLLAVSAESNEMPIAKF